MALVEVERVINGIPLTFQEDEAVAKERGFKIIERDKKEPVKATSKKTSKK